MEFHREPELGNKEFKTADRIERYLHNLGANTRSILDTAVIGVLEGVSDGPSIALRADIDALPINEDTGASFASVTHGIMHACGHDIHITAALGAARLMSEYRDEFPGKLILLFQPDEEGNGGALRMIESGVLDGVSAIFGAHVTPDLPLGHVGVRYGKFYAASETFSVNVKGKSAHGAEREKGIDALAAAAEMVSEALRIPNTLPQESGVISVGTFHAGTAINILAGSAKFTGIIRALGSDMRAIMAEKFRSLVLRIARDFGAEVECNLRESYPGVVNDYGMTRLVHETASAIFGTDCVHVIDSPTMTTEDFGYFLHHVPGSFYHVGAGCSLPLHNAGFLPDGEASVIAAALHASVVKRAMEIFC
jgi:amidohydrolase